MKNILLLLFCAYSLSAACEDGLWLSAVDLNKDSTMAKLFAAIDDSLYEKMKKTEWNELSGLCGCAGGGVFVQSRHIDLMGKGWHFNWCGNPDSIVFYEDENWKSKDLILKKNSVLFNQIQTLKKLIKEKGCRPDSVYEFLENELAPENAKKGIYVLKLPIISVCRKMSDYLKFISPMESCFAKSSFHKGSEMAMTNAIFQRGKSISLINTRTA